MLNLVVKCDVDDLGPLSPSNARQLSIMLVLQKISRGQLVPPRPVHYCTPPAISLRTASEVTQRYVLRSTGAPCPGRAPPERAPRQASHPVERYR
jgi:hypothetical protein